MFVEPVPSTTRRRGAELDLQPRTVILMTEINVNLIYISPRIPTWDTKSSLGTKSP